MTLTQKMLARAVEAKLLDALAAVEKLAEYERTEPVATHVAFTQLPRVHVERWQARLNEVAAGRLTV